MLVNPNNLPTAEELELGRSDRPNVQELLDNPAFQAGHEASKRLAEWASRMNW